MKTLAASFVTLCVSVALIWFGLDKNKIKQTHLIQFNSESLSQNKMGEDIERSVYVYLPPGYDTSKASYPCLYYLHGFTSTHEEYKRLNFEQLMNEAIRLGLIAPCILVVPNSYTQYEGSFYTNSELNGKWADYIAKDLVNLIDQRYRTKPQANQRGLFGHSMGGNGALKIALQYPDVFGAVYALSPSAMDWSDEFNLNNPSFESILKAKDIGALAEDFYARIFIAMGRVYSPDLDIQPFQCRLPVKSNRQIDSSVLQKWNEELVLRQYQKALEQGTLKPAVGFDCGLEDEFKHIPVTCQKLDSLMIKHGYPHLFSTYRGNHYEQVGGIEGRIVRHALPFFDKHLRGN
ncbi:MAG: alpha/beta hydrolase [Bacteroidetes bacterium]|nr:alpha/beta hydrolase [Bacteroidota bacterium]